MDKPLRILTVVDLPWDPRLGRARAYIELANQWRSAGHIVEKFCLTDAFPIPAKSQRVSALREILFAYRAASYVRRNASRFDVIDALIGTLPFSKTNLRFEGLLVGRSVGLYGPYEKFFRFSRKRWPNQPRGKILGRFSYKLKRRWLHRNSDLAVRSCDLLNLPNDDEVEFLRETPFRKKPAIVQPYGLNEQERAAFASAMQPAEVRLKKREVCFVGMWGLRKGARDWAEIIRQVRDAVPDAQFTFLGTMTDEATVLKDLHLSRRDGVRCVTTYNPEDLPGLLAPCAVGLFPSYIEGFGLAVLEQIACGIPTVAYDVSGPREILKTERETLLTPEGDPKAIAERAVKILRMNPNEYAQLSHQCSVIADHFRWEQIASNTAREYAVALLRARQTE